MYKKVAFYDVKGVLTQEYILQLENFKCEYLQIETILIIYGMDYSVQEKFTKWLHYSEYAPIN